MNNNKFKDIIANEVIKAIDISYDDAIAIVEVPKGAGNGDYAFPCFKLASILHKAPVQIADEIKEKINNPIFEKVENVNGFLNFFVSKDEIVKEVVSNFKEKDKDFGKDNIGEGKTVIVEFSSPNIAKPFHIGHLKTTIIGNSLYKIYEALGYKVIRLNHLGDYGTQFAKLIEGYKRWGEEYDFEENPIDKLADIYKRINELCEEDENVLEECRDTFKKLEDGDPFCVELWNKFKDLSLKEFNRIYDLLNISFDSMNGESFYSDKMDEVVSILEKSGKLTESNGAKIVDLSDVGIETPCIIQKADGASIYATRDLAAILYRTREYNFDKCIYVVGSEQSLHFKQIFAVAKYLGIDEKYLSGLEHVSYGMIRLPEGKMSSRKGNFVKVEDLLNDSINEVKSIMSEKGIEDINIAKQIGVGAVIFDDLKDSRNKDQVFDLKEALNFNGETGPYVQYTTVRTKSILEKAKNEAGIEVNANTEIDYSKLTDEASLRVIKLLEMFENTIKMAQGKNEPSIITRYIVNLAESFSTFYNQNKVITDDESLTKARLYLTYMVNITLTNGLKLLGIEVPEKM